MKALKIYLMVMGGLLTVALFAGVIVWYLYQDLPGANPRNLISDTEVNETHHEVESIPQSEENISTTNTPASKDVPVYTITPDSLSENQRAVLTSFGVGGSSFVVTEGMILCAKVAVGEARFAEILDGSAPGPLEAMSLLACTKK
jgi:hypothetical protein